MKPTTDNNKIPDNKTPDNITPDNRTPDNKNNSKLYTIIQC